MGFGQQAGPPATHGQLKDLLELLQNAGYQDFREARGPMGFNQRQAGGKFTNAEAQELIDQLQEAEWAVEEEQAGIRPTAKPAAKPAAKKAEPRSKASNRSNASGAPKTSRNTAARNTAPRNTAPRTAAPRLKAKATIDLTQVTDQDLAAELQDRGWVVMEP